MSWWTALLFLLGACIYDGNFYLSFLRYPLHRLRGGTRAGFRFVSGFPLVGSMLVFLVWTSWSRSPESTTTVDVIAWVLIALDTGGLHWIPIAVLLGYVASARRSRHRQIDERHPRP